MDSQEKDLVFPKEGISNAVKNSVDSVLSFESPYQHNKVGHQVNTIIEAIMKRLTDLNMPFKYIVQCVILQNNGAGFHTASTGWWNACDGMYTHRLEGKQLFAISTVYALSL